MSVQAGNVLDSAFLFDLESNMRTIFVNTYNSLNAKTWWRRLARQMTSGSRKERLNWLIETGYLQYGVEGQAIFEDMATKSTEFEHQFMNGSGLKLQKSQLEDLDGNGIDVAGGWSRTMGALSVYFPQQELAKAIIANPTAYDGLAFFNASHLLHPGKASVGTYSNVFTGGASGGYPGACPIDAANASTVDVAVANLYKAIAYIRSILQPNGVNPRNLVPITLFVPPALKARAWQVTGAKFIAMAAASGGGGADVSGIMTDMNLEVVEVPEFAATMPNGSDTTYYIGCEELTGELGSWIYSSREPFNISMHGPMTDAQLASKRVYEWLPNGRSVIAPGHPYLMFKGLGT